jgi:hypothetical protein
LKFLSLRLRALSASALIKFYQHCIWEIIYLLLANRMMQHSFRLLKASHALIFFSNQDLLDPRISKIEACFKSRFRGPQNA